MVGWLTTFSSDRDLSFEANSWWRELGSLCSICDPRSSGSRLLFVGSNLICSFCYSEYWLSHMADCCPKSLSARISLHHGCMLNGCRYSWEGFLVLCEIVLLLLHGLSYLVSSRRLDPWLKRSEAYLVLTIVCRWSCTYYRWYDSD